MWKLTWGIGRLGGDYRKGNNECRDEEDADYHGDDQTTIHDQALSRTWNWDKEYVFRDEILFRCHKVKTMTIFVRSTWPIATFTWVCTRFECQFVNANAQICIHQVSVAYVVIVSDWNAFLSLHEVTASTNTKIDRKKRRYILHVRLDGILL